MGCPSSLMSFRLLLVMLTMRCGIAGGDAWGGQVIHDACVIGVHRYASCVRIRACARLFVRQAAGRRVWRRGLLSVHACRLQRAFFILFFDVLCVRSLFRFRGEGGSAAFFGIG